jgi:hypothetical protein
MRCCYCCTAELLFLLHWWTAVLMMYWCTTALLLLLHCCCCCTGALLLLLLLLATTKNNWFENVDSFFKWLIVYWEFKLSNSDGSMNTFLGMYLQNFHNHVLTKVLKIVSFFSTDFRMNFSSQDILRMFCEHKFYQKVIKNIFKKFYE